MGKKRKAQQLTLSAEPVGDAPPLPLSAPPPSPPPAPQSPLVVSPSSPSSPSPSSSSPETPPPAASSPSESPDLSALRLLASDSPLSFDVHLQLLRALGAAGEVDELREARERMSSTFPLTADLWREWLADERSRIDSEVDQRRLLALHERSCRDYLVPSLWSAYCQYAEELHSDAPTDGSLASLSVYMQPVRDVYAEAEAALHCHCTAAEMVMRPFRKLELRTLTLMLRLKQRHEEEEDEEAGADDSEEEEGEESAQEREDNAVLMAQLDLIRDLYRRSMSWPVNGLEQVHSEYRQWVTKQQYEVEEDISRTYQASLRDRTARLPFEQALQACQAESDSPTGIASPTQLSAWYSYIRFEQTAKDEDGDEDGNVRWELVIGLYERALTQCFLHSDVWHSYYACLGARPRANELRLDLSRRAVRNLPLDGTLWAAHVQSMEGLALGHAPTTYLEVLSRAEQAMEGRSEQLLPVCVALLDCIRRQRTPQPALAPSSLPLFPPFSPASIQRIVERALTAIRYTGAAVSATTAHVELCLDFFSSFFDLLLDMEWGVERAREEMQRWLNEKRPGVRAWSEWIRIERRLGHSDIAHRLFPESVAAPHTRPIALLAAERGGSSTSPALCLVIRALKHAAQDWGVEQLCYDWLRFEAECGDLSMVDVAQKHCAPIISQLSSLKAQPHPDGAVSSPSSDAFAAQERKESALQPQREGVSATTAEPSPGKKQKRPTASRRSKAFTADDGKRAKAAPNQKLRKRRDGAENSQVGDEGNGGSAPPAKRPRKAQAPSTAQVEDGPSPSDSSSNAELATQPPVPASPTDGAAVQAATQSPSLTPFYTAPNHALRISNLPPQTTASILRDVFSKYGQVQDVHVEVDLTSADAHVGHVLYASKDAVKPAVSAAHGTDIDGRSVSVESVASFNRHRKRLAKAAQGRPLRVFVKGLPPVDDLESLLRAHFADCGAIRRVTLTRDKDTRKVKGIAYVEFDDQEGADKALHKNGTQLVGHPSPILVVRDQPPPPRPHPPNTSTVSASPSLSPPLQTSIAQPPVRAAPAPKLGLVPRSVRAARPLGSATADRHSSEKNGNEPNNPSKLAEDAASTNSTSAAPTPALSNADFRTFLQRGTR